MFLSYLAEHNRYWSLVGIAVVFALATLFSKKRSAINYTLVARALLMQFAIAFIVLKTTVGSVVVNALARGVDKLYEFADQGIGFVFGDLANPAGPWHFIFAVKVLPIIIFFGAFMALLFHWGIIQRVVACIEVMIRPVLGTSGSETLCAIANSFLGQTEAPLLIRNYLGGMTDSELLVVMVSGMATISGALLAVFASMGVPVTHLLASSVMSIPSSLLIAKILLPETEKSATRGGAMVGNSATTKNIFDAIATGTSDGLHLALNVGAMLISFLALLALVNSCLGYGCYLLNHLFFSVGLTVRIPELSLSLLFSYFFGLFGYLLGFTGQEALFIGELIGTKVAVNEMVAYGKLVSMKGMYSERLANIVTYALCGFSNFSCIGIQVGGIGVLVPEKRQLLTELGLYAVLGGALANILNAMVASLLL